MGKIIFFRIVQIVMILNIVSSTYLLMCVKILDGKMPFGELTVSTNTGAVVLMYSMLSIALIFTILAEIAIIAKHICRAQ